MEGRPDAVNRGPYWFVQLAKDSSVANMEWGVYEGTVTVGKTSHAVNIPMLQNTRDLDAGAQLLAPDRKRMAAPSGAVPEAKKTANTT